MSLPIGTPCYMLDVAPAEYIGHVCIVLNLGPLKGCEFCDKGALPVCHTRAVHDGRTFHSREWRGLVPLVPTLKESSC